MYTQICTRQSEGMENATALVSLNPADGAEVGRVPITPAESIGQIVREARLAAEDWRAMSLQQRGDALIRAGDRLVARADELGELLSREMGKPLARGIGEVRSVGAGMRTKVERAMQALQTTRERGAGVETSIVRDPLGVCAVISPWNYPMSMVHWMSVPALMAGNAVVLKPSEETPLIAEAYAEALQAELPAGMFRVVHGGDAQGKALVAADVDLIAFTGSREAGIHIMRSAAGGLKRLVLELGGKDPLLVLPGADVRSAARFAVDNGFANSGQMCVSTERVFVHSSIAAEFEALVVEMTAEHRCGAYDDEGVTVGPMIHERQREHVLSQMREAVGQGAELLAGTLEPNARYVFPSVLKGVTDEMRIARDETFGPVLCLTAFDDLDAALRSANAGPFGLGAVVFGPEAEAEAAASRLNAGMIGINRSIFGVGDTPWVGAKQSGYGYHGSPDGARQFAQTRVLSRKI